jgi:hypothetical protein
MTVLAIGGLRRRRKRNGKLSLIELPSSTYP